MKAILTLSQQCDFSLYIIKVACPLFILSAVLLFTKSPSLQLLLIENYVVSFEYPISQKPMLQFSIIPLLSSTLNKWLNATCLSTSLRVLLNMVKTAAHLTPQGPGPMACWRSRTASSSIFTR